MFTRAQNRRMYEIFLSSMPVAMLTHRRGVQGHAGDARDRELLTEVAKNMLSSKHNW